MLETLQNIDETIFHWINADAANPFFDQFMPWVTNLHLSSSGIAVLSLFLAILFWRYRGRAVKATLLSGCALALTDSFSHYVLKQFFVRPRPQYLPDAVVRTFQHVGYSFPSNHAANNMAIAIIFSVLIPELRLGFLCWAILIGLSRIYVGVHYPFDVLGGYVVGACMALIVLIAAKKLKSVAGFSRARS